MIGTLDLILVLLFSLITIYFIWGVVQYISAGGDDEKIAKGKKHMLWGIIGLAVVASAWGMAKIITNYLGAGEGARPRVPQFRNISPGTAPKPWDNLPIGT